MAKSSRNLNAKVAQMRSVSMETKRTLRVGRNEKCPCGSGRKYKDCHQDKGEEYLQKLYRESEKKKLLEQQKRDGVPWIKRMLTKAFH
jgi:hypothetical protein